MVTAASVKGVMLCIIAKVTEPSVERRSSDRIWAIVVGMSMTCDAHVLWTSVYLMGLLFSILSSSIAELLAYMCR